MTNLASLGRISHACARVRDKEVDRYKVTGGVNCFRTPSETKPERISVMTLSPQLKSETKRGDGRWRLAPRGSRRRLSPVFVFMSSLPKSDETKCELGKRRRRRRRPRQGVNFLVAITACPPETWTAQRAGILRVRPHGSKPRQDGEMLKHQASMPSTGESK